VYDNVLPTGALGEVAGRVRQVFREQLGEASEPSTSASVSAQPVLRMSREERALHMNMSRESGIKFPTEVPGEVCQSSESIPACNVRDLLDVSDGMLVSET
jgi:hypothetical protein